MTFEEADKVVHQVWHEWHCPILLKYGFQPITKTGVGFVRSFIYERGDGEKIKMTTGCNADYFEVLAGTPNTQEKCYPGNLEPHLQTLPPHYSPFEDPIEYHESFA